MFFFIYVLCSKVFACLTFLVFVEGGGVAPKLIFLQDNVLG